MPAIGYSVNTMNGGFVSGPQEPNVIAGISAMPQDGWLTYADLRAGGREGSIRAKIGIWSATDGKLLYASPQQRWGQGRYVHGTSLPDIPLRRGERFFRGFWRPQADFAWWGLYEGAGQYHLGTVYGDIPDSYTAYATNDSATLVGQTSYVANAAPLAGSWRTAPSGTVGTYNPLFEGTLPHPVSEGGRDHTTAVQVRIRDKSTGVMVYDQTFSPTAEELRQGYFSRRLFTHEPGHAYWANFRHRDSWGEWPRGGDFGLSEQSHYVTDRAPGKPKMTRPEGKINYVSEAGSPFSALYSGTYSHADNRAMNAVQVEVYNANGSIRLYNSGKVASGADNDTWFLSQFHPNLSWAAQYKVRARTWDNLDVPSDFGPFNDFRTNAAPFAPSNLSPASGDITGSNLLSCVARDPDGDDIRSVTFQYRRPGAIATSVVVTGPFRSGSRVTIRPSLTYGNVYEWRAGASDGTLLGSYTGWQSFVYDQVPTVSMVSPQQRGYVNAISQPSAEYDPAEVGQRWTEFGRAEPALDAEGFPMGSYSAIDRVKDGDTPLIGREWCWRAVYDQPGPEWYFASERLKANTTTPGILTAWIKTEFGNPRSYLRIDCFDSTGARLGSVYPDSIRILNNALPDDSWTRYGGLIPVGMWPAGTTQVEIRLYPNAGASADTGSGAIRFDAFLFQHDLPAGAAEGSDAWYGYGDGDTAGYGPNSTTSDYYWTGLRGNSPSVTLNRLTKPAGGTTVRISYQGNAAKVNDRTVIEQWTGLEWKRLYAPGYPATPAGGRTTVPLPSGVIKNEGHYRVAVIAQDRNGQAVSTGWVYFGTAYTGPPEIPVEQVTSNENEAKLSISWVPSELPPGEFAHYEIRTRSPSEGEITRLVTGDQALSQFDHHWPRSDEPYDFEVRQAQVIGSEVVEGPWRGSEVTVSYRDVHLKDLDSPGQYRFSHPIEADDEPSQEYRANRASYRPRGARAAVHYVGEQRDMAGSFTVKIIDGLEARGKLDALLELAERRGGVALLMPRPARVLFVSLDDIKETSTDIPYLAAYDISYEETHFSPDYTLRELEAT